MLHCWEHFFSKFGFSVHIPVNLLSNMNRLRGQQAPVFRTCAQTNKMEFFIWNQIASERFNCHACWYHLNASVIGSPLPHCHFPAFIPPGHHTFFLSRSQSNHSKTMGLYQTGSLPQNSIVIWILLHNSEFQSQSFFWLACTSSVNFCMLDLQLLLMSVSCYKFLQKQCQG